MTATKRLGIRRKRSDASKHAGHQIRCENSKRGGGLHKEYTKLGKLGETKVAFKRFKSCKSSSDSILEPASPMLASLSILHAVKYASSLKVER